MKMKKILLVAIAIIGLTVSMSAQLWQNPPKDNTGRNLTFCSKTVTLAATDSINPGFSETYYVFAVLAEAKTIIIKTTAARKWDRVTLEFTSDGNGAGRVVTFSTISGGIINSLWTTITGDAFTVKQDKKFLIRFIYDGTQWGEESSSIQF